MNELKRKILQLTVVIAIVDFRLFAMDKIMGVNIPIHSMKLFLLR